MQHTDLDTTVLDERLAAAKEASYRLATATTAEKNAALEQVALLLHAAAGEIIAANALDLDAGREAGLAAGLIDRLTLDQRRVDALAQAVLEGIALTATIRESVSGRRLPTTSGRAAAPGA